MPKVVAPRKDEVLPEGSAIEIDAGDGGASAVKPVAKPKAAAAAAKATTPAAKPAPSAAKPVLPINKPAAPTPAPVERKRTTNTGGDVTNNLF